MSRTVIIGLDGFHEKLLDYTPYLETLYEENPSGPLKSTTPPVTAPAWASFQTGKNQGKHGIFDFITYDEEFQLEFLDGQSLRAEPFYERLDHAGFDCLLYNLPFALPARVSGDIVPSWLDSDDAAPVPEDLYEKLGIDPPRYPELDGDRLEQIAEMRTCFNHNSTQFLTALENGNHDVLFQLISVTDWLQHTGYRELRESSDGQVAERTKDLLNHVDEYIKSLNEEINKGDTLLLLSDHGFKVFDGQFYLNDWLEQQGLLETGSESVEDKSNDSNNTVDLGAVGRFIAQQEWLYPILRVLKNTARSKLGIEFAYEKGIDFENSIAYCLSDDEAAIRFSESTDGTKTEKLVEQVLSNLEDVDGVRPINRQELYDGAFADKAGEIIISSKNLKVSRGPVGRVKSNAAIAHHSSMGLFIAVNSSNSGSDDVSTASLVDIAPTILALCNQPVPKDMDGKVLTEALDIDFEFTDPTEYEPMFTSSNNEDKTEVEDRLSNLGYL